ncbi:MAG: hypothetical protein IPN34_21810 [Planctomycetes bacterium]|nr:hypothetical protein [Planctomycetota bacterium]
MIESLKGAASSGLDELGRALEGAPELDLEPGVERARLLAERLGRSAEALTPQALGALQSGLAQLASGLDTAGSDAVISALLHGLRQQRPGAASEFLAQWLALGSSADHARLFPHALHEILLGARRSAGPAQALLHDFVGKAEVERADPQFARLQRLEAVRLGRLARRFFAPTPPRALFPLLARLVEAVPGSAMCTWMLQCLQEDLPTWKGAQALRALTPHASATRPIVLAILREGAWDSASPALQEQLSNYLAKKIDALSPDRRAEPWVVTALEALADLPSPAAAALGQRILLERRYGFLPQWSGTCRKAARALFSGAESAS